MGEVGWRMAGAWLVLAPGASAPSEDETVEWCRARLARFELARHVLSISADELPATATGKVQRFRLVELAQERLR